MIFNCGNEIAKFICVSPAMLSPSPANRGKKDLKHAFRRGERSNNTTDAFQAGEDKRRVALCSPLMGLHARLNQAVEQTVTPLPGGIKKEFFEIRKEGGSSPREPGTIPRPRLTPLF
jgi:hypothetical protein